MISAIYVLNSAGLKLYSKIFDSKIDLDDILLMSFLSAIQMYAESTMDENIQSIELQGMHIIYLLPNEKKTDGVMIVIVAQQVNSAILIRAGYIIDLIRKELLLQDNFSQSILQMEKHSKEIARVEGKIDQIMDLSDSELESITKESYIIKLEKILDQLSKRIPVKSLVVDPRIHITEKNKLKVDPSLSEFDTERIIEKLRSSITRLYGSKIFDEAFSKE